jgi:crotonobetainyl-CoA:carnitine CoA-transferase CaiB-like acyl-CoA transferase
LGALCDGLDLPDLKGELHQAGSSASTTQAIAECFATRPAKEWVQRLAPAGAAVTIVNRGEQVVEDEHVVARRSVVTVGGVSVPANPIRIKAAGGASTSTSKVAPPLVGDDTQDVLASAGFSSVELSELRKTNVI